MFDLRPIKVLVLGALAMLLAFTMPSFSTAKFTSSSSSSLTVTSGTWVTPDTTSPTVTLTVPDQVSGTQTVTARAADNPGGTGVKSVTFQTRLAHGVWTDRHTSTSANASWSWSTNAVSGGYYDVRAKATDGAGNEGFSSVTRTLVLNGIALVMTPPTETVSGLVPLRADVLQPDNPWLWWSLTLQYRPLGGTENDWSTVGLPNVNTHSITRWWSTYGLANGDYELRAVREAVWPFPSLTSTIVQVTVQNPRFSALTVTDLKSATAASEPSPDTPDEDQVEPAVEPSTEDLIPVEPTAVDPVTEEEFEDETVVEPAPQEPPIVPGDEEDETGFGDEEDETGFGDEEDETGFGDEEETAPGDEVIEAELRGVSLDATDGGNGVGALDEGGSFTFTYSGEVDLTTVLPGWAGEATAVSVRLRDGALLGGSAQDDTLDVRSGDLPVELGHVHLGADVIDIDQQMLLPATMTAGTVTVDGALLSTVTVTLGSVVDGDEVLLPATTVPTLTWTPSASVTTLTGRLCLTEPVTQSAGETF